MSSAVEYVVEYDEAYNAPWLVKLDGEVIDAFFNEDVAREECAKYNADAAQS